MADSVVAFCDLFERAIGVFGPDTFGPEQGCVASRIDACILECVEDRANCIGFDGKPEAFGF